MEVPAGQEGFAAARWIDAGGIGWLPGRTKGSYVLLFRLEKGRTLAAGSRPEEFFPAGYYAYAGSAMGGVRSRLARHLSVNKRRHWHIDYLLAEAGVMGAYIRSGRERCECTAAGRLAARFEGFPGFGCSDCRCRSHLFFDVDLERLREGAREALSSEDA